MRVFDAGWSRDQVVSTLAHYSAKDETKWKSGRISGCVYHGGDDLSQLMTEAFSRYALSNPLHPDVFPSLRKVRLPSNCWYLGLRLLPLSFVALVF